MFPIANINFFLNGNEFILNSNYFISIKEALSSSIEEYLSQTKIYGGISITYYSYRINEIAIIVFLKFVGIYQSEINYKFIYEVINKLKNEYKNKIIRVSSDNVESSCLVAVKNYEIINTKDIYHHLEKYYSQIAPNYKDEFYDIDINFKDILTAISDKIQQNEYFLKTHRTTKFHDIDIKLWETRQALACGLSLTSIVMLGVTLEECLKTVLKSDYEQEMISSNISKISDDELTKIIADASLKAEEEYGDWQLYKLIVELHNKKFIDEEERKHLIYIKDYIRNAFIHSDKSKIFNESQKGPVNILQLVDGQIKHVKTEELSMLQMSYAQGLMQKKLADENAKKMFYEIENYIYIISKRFWDKWK